MHNLISRILHPRRLSPATTSASTHPSHLILLHPRLLLLLPESVVLALVKEGPAQLLLALLNLLEKVQLTHLLDQVLVLLFLLGDFLLLKLLLSFLQLKFSLGLFMLFYLFDEETAPDTTGTAVLSRTILNEEASKGIVLTF